MESIGATIKEYLVNSTYLTTLCEKFNLRLIENVSFEEVYSSDVEYGNMKDMNDSLKEYSFLNNYFIYQKI